MLTKDLVKFQLRGKQVKPAFIDATDADLLELAERLLVVFRDALGKSRSRLEEESRLVLETSTANGVIGRGLQKLLLDRVEFETSDDEDLMDWRWNLFRKSSGLLSHEALGELRQYQEAVAKQCQDGEGRFDIEDLQSKLFSDLPENQPVTRFRSFSAERLLHRYNCAQVQWLLLHSHALVIRAEQHETKAWRQFFRYLRFHQLLAAIEKTPDGAYEITVDGPMSLFQQTKKYALSLAAFFPAVLHLPKWRFEAEIRLRNRKPKRLVLDESSGLRPYSGQFLSHVPEGVEMFRELFSKTDSEWEVHAADAFVVLPGDAYGFPDFALRHREDGRQIALELFHAWHGRALLDRLNQLTAHEGAPLLLGVERKLAKDPEVKEQLDRSSYFERWGFLFRDMPSPRAVLACLAQA